LGSNAFGEGVEEGVERGKTMSKLEEKDLQTEIETYRKRISELKDPADRWRCMVLLKRVELELLTVKYRRQPC
jgi:hypothetical protein